MDCSEIDSKAFLAASNAEEAAFTWADTSAIQPLHPTGPSDLLARRFSRQPGSRSPAALVCLSTPSLPIAASHRDCPLIVLCLHSHLLFTTRTGMWAKWSDVNPRGAMGQERGGPGRLLDAVPVGTASPRARLGPPTSAHERPRHVGRGESRPQPTLQAGPTRGSRSPRRTYPSTSGARTQAWPARGSAGPRSTPRYACQSTSSHDARGGGLVNLPREERPRHRIEIRRVSALAPAPEKLSPRGRAGPRPDRASEPRPTRRRRRAVRSGSSPGGCLARGGRRPSERAAHRSVRRAR